MTRSEFDQLESADWGQRASFWYQLASFRAAAEYGLAGAAVPEDPDEFYRGLPTILRLLGVSIYRFRRDIENAVNAGHGGPLAGASRSIADAIESHLIDLLRRGVNDAADPILWATAPDLQRHICTVNEHTALPFHVLPAPFCKLPTISDGLVFVGPAGATFCRLSDARDRVERFGERERWNAIARAQHAEQAAREEKKRWEESDSGKLARLQAQIDELKQLRSEG